VSPAPAPAGPRRALVVHPGALGDVLLALPALAHLGHLAPGARRVLAAAPRIGALLAGGPEVEEAAELDALGLHRLFTADGDPATLDRLAGFDPVVSWLGAGDAAFRRHLEALAARGRRVVLARGTPAPGHRRHASWHFVDTLAALGAAPPALPPVRLAASPAERAWAGAWLAARGLAPGTAVVLHPGAGSPAKAWPGFPGLAAALRAAGWPVVVVVGPADADPAARLARTAGLPEACLARELSLRQLVALGEAARAFVGNDSGLSHLTALTGCPTLALFGPTDPAVWAPLGPAVRVLAGAGPGAADPWHGLDVDRVLDALTIPAAGPAERVRLGG
jgi:heptosyltransferase-3